MELYILDSAGRRVDVVEGFESLIWTERYMSWGDFELSIDPALAASNSQFIDGSYLAMSESNRIMVVETLELRSEADGKDTLKVTGRSLEKILDERPNHYPTNYRDPLVLTGKPAELVRTAFDSICRPINVTVVQDRLTGLQPGTITPAGTILEPLETVQVNADLDTLYSLITSICETYHLGFRLIRNGDLPGFYFEVYTGDDRTSRQGRFPAVIFAKSLDNLSDTTELHSSSLRKTVAYVYSENGQATVYAAGSDSSSTGVDRRVLIVKADDITEPAGPTLTTLLEQRGREELTKNNFVVAFDGKIEANGRYKYGVDYHLGDLVEQRNDAGLITDYRVIEQVFVSDSEGIRSYPTLAIDDVITPGSWYSWTANEFWDDAIGTWDEAALRRL